MARGWESKAIESQQEEAERQRSLGAPRADSAIDRATVERRRTLEMARARALADLAAARVEMHRGMLRQALEALDAQLASLAGDGP